MGIFRVKKDSNYVSMNKTALQDDRLSWRAKGLLAYMLSMPDDWTFYNEELSRHSKDGLTTLKTCVKELKQYGYLARKPVKDSKGKITEWETHVYEVPEVAKPLDGETSDRENQSMDSRPLLSNDLVLNNKIKLNNEDIKEIISFLNDKCSSSYKPSTKKTKNLIYDRLSEGYTLDDFKKVITIKTADWITDNKMSQYLRPETLFGTKFESYLNQKVAQPNGKNSELDEIRSKYNFNKEITHVNNKPILFDPSTMFDD